MKPTTIAALCMMLGGWLLLTGEQDPVPNPDPVFPVNPDPPGPAPIAEVGNRVLIVYESSALSTYPAKQGLIMRSGTFRDYLDANCTPGPDGGPEYRIWDQDTDLTNVPQTWQDAMKLERKSLPWLIASNGTTGITVALPATEAATIELLRKYLK
jgi:hypothetical protein